MKNNGGGVLTPHKEVGEQGGTKVPHPREELVQNGGGVLTPPNTAQNAEKATNSKRHSHLPHIDSTEYYQFVTFRTHDSVDEFIQKYDLDSTLSNKEKQLKIDDYLDTSLNGAYLQNEVLDYLYTFLLAQDKKLYELVTFAIMSNHVHILLKPLESLSRVVKKVKGSSAKRINELMGKNGRFWSDDYYDKAIRDEKHFWVVYEYIKNNPLKLGNGEKGGVRDVAPLSRFYGVFE